LDIDNIVDIILGFKEHCEYNTETLLTLVDLMLENRTKILLYELNGVLILHACPLP